MRRTTFLIFALLLILPTCGGHARAPDVSSSALPAMRWDHRPEAKAWTRAALAAMTGHGAVLSQVQPSDVADWCPAYVGNSQADRNAFWVGLLSAMAKHESTWNPDAVGGGGQWFGLLQISPATAQGYGCRATSGAGLQDGSANLSCAIRIIAQTVPRDGVIAAERGGVAADWGPFRNDEKRADMVAWTSSQSYCR